MKKWTILNSTYIYQNKWLTVRKDDVLTGKNVEIPDFYVLEYLDWINVIAITADGEFIVEKQYRHGIQSVHYELCAGVCENGELPIEAAKRELWEETGYGEGTWILYDESVPNSNSMNNKCYTFLATGVKRIDHPHPEATEDIEVHLFTLSEIKELLVTNQIIEGVMQAPLWRYLAEHSSK